MTFSFVDMLGRAAPRINIVDVGAMWMGEEYCSYRGLLRKDCASVIGFEPVAEECEKLNKLGLKNHTYLPYFIGDGRDGLFRLCSSPMTSSLYEPNMKLLSKFNQLVELMTPVARTPVKTRRLDDVAEIERIDYLKVDVQGGEHAVISGAEKRLADTVVVETEVEFVQLYVDQPLFADVDAALRRRGFVMHSLSQAMGRAFKPMVPGGDIRRRVKQALWADAVYVKDFTKFDELSQDQLLRMAVVLHDVYGSIDLAALALQHHDRVSGKSLWKPYMTRLFGAKTPEAPPMD